MKEQVISETRAVGQFDRLVVHDPADWVVLVIREGRQESLTIQAPPATLARIRTAVKDGVLRITLGGSLIDRIGDALTTSLTRKRVRYELTVCRLTQVQAWGMVRVDTQGLIEHRPVVKLGGPAATWRWRQLWA